MIHPTIAANGITTSIAINQPFIATDQNCEVYSSMLPAMVQAPAQTPSTQSPPDGLQTKAGA